jgi:nitrogen-specific signal transduction histidine kinase
MGATPELQKELVSGTLRRRNSRNNGATRIGVSRSVRESAALRLLSAERSDEIFPILLEEIVSSGFLRALALEVDFETGEFKPKAALNCSKTFQQQVSASLWAHEHPLVGILNSMQPQVVPELGQSGGSLYCHPLLYRNRSLCWEAERERRHDCLAVHNFHSPRKLRLEEQVCATCHMRAYAAMVVVEMGSQPSPAQTKQLRALIELANRYLSRLFKVEHYFNRMRDMDVTISQMHTVMESMADPVILTDTHHRVIMQNRAAERFLRPPEQVSEGGARAVEFNNLLFSAALSSMSVSGAEGFRDLSLVDVTDGEEVLFEAVCAPTYGTDGMRSGMVTVMRDVTDLRRADQEVRANLNKLQQVEEIVRQDRDRLNLVIENVGDPIVVADASASIVLFDPLAKQLFGDETPSNVGRDPGLMQNVGKFDAYLQRFTFSFEDKHGETLALYNPSTGGDVEYDIRSGKIYNARGQVAFTVNVLRDFSAWKKVEELKMQTRMLEMEKFAATGRLAGTIAHEVNNPMEAIKNSIHLLSRHVDRSGLELYDLLRRETDRVSRIVRQMLGLYRANDRPMAFDLNSVIDDTLTLFARQLEKSGIKAEKKLGALPHVVGSADQMRQVISNLVVNAKDSMSAGGRLAVRSGYRRTADGKGVVRVLVADNGAGIPRELLRDIFEPFVSTKGERGTGLGLWIVKGIVENHAGRIRVRSHEGKGTTFLLEVPVVRSL